MKMRLSRIHEVAASRPPGYVEDVLSRGMLEGEWLEISSDAYKELKRKYAPPEPEPPAPALPPVHVMAKNAATAVKQELKARFSGVPPVLQAEIDRRLAICNAPCEHFIPDQGRCAKCGCFTNFKAKLRSQHCPEGKW
jgi:hypothetical protein